MNKNKIKLSDINKENPFKVPENYFDNFYTNLKSKENEIEIEIEEDTKKIFNLNFNFKYARSIAASLILVALMIFQPTDISTQNNDYASAELTAEEFFIPIEDDYSLYSLFEIDVNETLNENEILDYLNSTLSDYELYVELNK